MCFPFASGCFGMATGREETDALLSGFRLRFRVAKRSAIRVPV
jgi:hypothetical protein